MAVQDSLAGPNGQLPKRGHFAFHQYMVRLGSGIQGLKVRDLSASDVSQEDDKVVVV